MGGEDFAVDASMITADAHRQRGLASVAELAGSGEGEPGRAAVHDGAGRGRFRWRRERYAGEVRVAGRSGGALAADTGYGSAETLAWLVDDQEIEPHIPVFDKSSRQDSKTLQRYRRRFKTPRHAPPKDDTLRYRASKADCDACKLKPACCPNMPARKVTRSVHDVARDNAPAYRSQRLAHTDAVAATRVSSVKGFWRQGALARCAGRTAGS